MECAKQGYWSFEYWEHKEVLPDTESNRNYCNFSKRQYHKARRRHDEQLIEEHLNGGEDDLYMPCIYDNIYVNDINSHKHREHNHKVKLREVA